MLGTAIASSSLRPFLWPQASLPARVFGLCQQTLAKSVACVGVGVHSGDPVSMTIKPAPVNTGYVFKRTDLQSDNHIEALWNTVTDTGMCTKITNAQGVSVSTIEHVLAALAGLHIHNVLIEVNGPEVPIMDGSAADFVTLIQEAGIKRQTVPVKMIRVLKPVQVAHATGTAALLPADERRLSMTYNFSGRLAETSHFSYYPDDDHFSECLADARTFGFFEDAQRLQAAGLARGASLHNTVVIGDSGILNEEGLRHPDEFVRHKILDAVGDLALAGGILLAHFDGVNSSHALNNQLLRALFADASAWEIMDNFVASHLSWATV
jgi:UDP-3-O-[3-hydroxymyristoyl] N-acetylglucosamine deacetylase